MAHSKIILKFNVKTWDKKWWTDARGVYFNTAMELRDL
jgi:hypothetical protein